MTSIPMASATMDQPRWAWRSANHQTTPAMMYTSTQDWWIIAALSGDAMATAATRYAWERWAPWRVRRQSPATIMATATAAITRTSPMRRPGAARNGTMGPYAKRPWTIFRGAVPIT